MLQLVFVLLAIIGALASKAYGLDFYEGFFATVVGILGLWVLVSLLAILWYKLTF